MSLSAVVRRLKILEASGLVRSVINATSAIERVHDAPPSRVFVAFDTEQGAFLDGWDHPDQREEGSRELLQALGRCLEAQTA